MSMSDEFFAKHAEFKKKGYVEWRETWFDGFQIKIGERNGEGLTVVGIEYPSNDADNSEMCFPRVRYAYDEKMEKYFESEADWRKKIKK